MKKRLFSLILTIALLFCSAISIYASPVSYTCTLKDGAVMRKVQTNEGILVTVTQKKIACLDIRITIIPMQHMAIFIGDLIIPTVTFKKNTFLPIVSQ